MKILVIEDDHRIAQYIQKGLQLKAHVVDLAHSGDQGFDLALNEFYDVIILDRMLPGIDGISICHQLRQADNHTPILMLTARTQVEDKVSGLEAGADDYLSKPFAFSELLARLNALSRRPQLKLNPILEIADLKLDTNNYQVTRAGKPIHLTKKEYALLEFLLRHPDKILTSDQLIEQVWPYDSDVLANTAQVYIGYLRNKIDKPFSNKPALIHTIRGFGYKLTKDPYV